MLYLLYGDVLYLINKEITKIIEQNKIEDINISKYELDSTNFKDIIEDASTISLFSDKKLIIVDNAYIFTSKDKAGDVSIFEEYFNNYNPDTIIIFKLNESKLDERKKIVKLIRKIGTVKDFNKGDNINKIIIDLLNEYKTSKENINLLIERVGSDIYQLQNEIEKIKLYKGDDKDITKEDIINLTSENIEVDLFKLMDAIIDNNKEKALIYYKEMIKLNMEPIQIIVALANKYRLMYQSKELSISGYNENEIGKELNQNPKYIYMLLKTGRKYTSDKLLNLLKQLAELDYKIKSGKVDKTIAFELFILEN